MASSNSPSPVNGTKLASILIVEDDLDVRESLREALEDEGYLVAAVAHGKEALDYLRKASSLPRLILLDVMMPVMDGFEFRRQQVSEQEWCSIPVVVVTANGNAAETCATMRAAGYLQKPLSVETLLATAERYVKAGRP